MNIPADENILNKIDKIRLLICDVDGVLTDGRIIMDHLGNESKHFHVRDGHGLKMLLRYGVGVALLTGRTSSVVAYRARDLGIEEVYQGIKNKGEFMIDYLQKRNLAADCIAYVGDDVVDIPVFKMVGLSITVADASEYAKSSADYVTERRGGEGAVREICELILMVQKKWNLVAARYHIE